MKPISNPLAHAAESDKPGSIDSASALDPKTLILLVLPPLFWAGNAVVGRLAVPLIQPFSLNCIRWVLASLILLPFAWAGLRGSAVEIRKHWRWLLMSSFMGISCYNSFQYAALHTSTPINVTLIGASGPVFILMIGAWVYGEAVTRRQIIGALLSMLGVFCVIVRGEVKHILSIHFALGDIYMLIATMCWSFYTWALRKKNIVISAAGLLFLQMVVGALLITPFVIAEILLHHSFIVWRSEVFWVLGYVAIFPSLIAYFCWSRGVARAGAQLPVYFANLIPVFTAVIGMLVLQEMPQLYHFLSLGLILLGISLASHSIGTQLQNKLRSP